MIAIKLGNHKITQEDKLCHLGSRITSNGRNKEDNVSRMAEAEKPFYH
jgi:hypothetical protein